MIIYLLGDVSGSSAHTYFFRTNNNDIKNFSECDISCSTTEAKNMTITIIKNIPGKTPFEAVNYSGLESNFGCQLYFSEHY